MSLNNGIWRPCAECGAPQLQLNQGTPEPCSVCNSQASVLPTHLGSVAIGLVSAAIIGLIAGSVAVLL